MTIESKSVIQHAYQNAKPHPIDENNIEKGILYGIQVGRNPNGEAVLPYTNKIYVM